MSEPQKQQENCPICNTTGLFDFDFIASEMCEFHRNCLFPKQSAEWLDKNCTGCSECEPDVHPKSDDMLVRESKCRICHKPFLAPALCIACEAEFEPTPVASEVKRQTRKIVQVLQFPRLKECNAFLGNLETWEVRQVSYTPPSEGYEGVYTVVFESDTYEVQQ